MNQTDTKIINQSITRFLARREYSYCELLRKLDSKGFCPVLCKQQLDKFVQKGLQSDQRFIESFVRNAHMNGKGPYFIRQALRVHDVDESYAHAHMQHEDYDWFELALKVRIKKFGEQIPHDFALKQKQMRFLQYRGFEQAHISFALSDSN